MFTGLVQHLGKITIGVNDRQTAAVCANAVTDLHSMGKGTSVNGKPYPGWFLRDAGDFSQMLYETSEH